MHSRRHHPLLRVQHWAPVGFLLALTAGVAAAQAVDSGSTYQPATKGFRASNLGPLAVKVLIDRAALGGDELELVEITFPAGAGTRGDGHTHRRVEVLYILSGELDHVVNGVAHHLVPGMAGIVRPGDTVIHRVTSADPVHALVIWAPGGELASVAP